ncbi:flagellar hook-basal body protein [Clostridium oryzae]|uniref:Flagellar hook protein FlgE n=1 Tax=Clostridium oryzae TaxID=1450648 RepID=A0A1V4ITB4_9CLOT|nr:flagellar hook-basal body complex protein [Clostridium oryzae]OPJ63271.1 flagellar basal-body rod protein FlgG [Clostridium oryzae]
MLRSLYSSQAGLGVNSTKLDVISNNIVNASTTAFKSSRARFEDTLYQNSRSASSPIDTLGGMNAAQVGLGVKVAGIDLMMKQGSMQPTNRNTDFAIDGEGFFMVTKGSSIYTDADGKSDMNVSNTTFNATYSGQKNNNVLYTRDGAFIIDDYGNLTTSDGYKVLGYAVTGVCSDGSTATKSSIVKDDTNKKGGYKVNFVDANNKDKPVQVVESTDDTTSSLVTLVIPSEINDNGTMRKVVSFSVDADGTVKANCGEKTAVIGQIAMAKFSNATGLEKTGSNMYKQSSNSGVAEVRVGLNAKVKSGGDEVAATSNAAAYGDILQNNLEMSNVDLAAEFSDMIVATRAFQACGKMITTDDEILQEIINLKR